MGTGCCAGAAWRAGLIAVACTWVPSRADIYMHNPRGSNNRLDRGNGNTENANRLFDSENNNAGGYAIGGDAESPAAPLKFIRGSELTFEWTSQHSCGQSDAHCQFILQYYCNDDVGAGTNVRDGTTTSRISTSDPGDQTRGLHETVEHYTKCQQRERNMGLWTADQNMGGRNKAIHTRQDRNGNQYGFECPEERDYYPYWHPSPWKDIAVLTTDATKCEYYKAESENVKGRGECVDPQFNNERACQTGGSQWIVRDSHGLDPPRCTHSPWLRDNHLGNSVGGRQTMLNISVPDELSSACIFRMRYNISSVEVLWDLDSVFNGDNSPLKQDPRIDVGLGINGGDESQLELAINTNQHGRTFQDRTHRFEIVDRPSGIPSSAKIYNINVRGKRGNIVQTYPATEYDFSPKVLSASPGSYIHFQWTGNDKTNNNGNNNGEGIDGTDRHNLLQMTGPGSTKPLHKDEATMWGDVEDSVTLSSDESRSADELFKEFALVFQTGCAAAADNPGDQDADNCEKLNAAAATIDLGLLKFKPGTYHFMSTRNHNFSNRAQKGAIHVQANVPPAPEIYETDIVSVDGLRIKWRMPAVNTAEGAIDATEPEEITAFEVEMSEDGGTNYADQGTFAGDVFEYTAYFLPAGITHTFRVRAQNSDGWSSWSEPQEGMVAESADSMQYKAALKAAAQPHDFSNEAIYIGTALGAATLVFGYMLFNWHRRRTILPKCCDRWIKPPAPPVRSAENQAIMRADEPHKLSA